MTSSSDSKTTTTISDDISTIDVTEDQPKQVSDLIKKKDIYDHVTVATGLRKREVREAVDATFAYLYDCLNSGKDVQCPPMGKIRVITKGEGANSKIIYKLNLQKPKEPNDTEAKGADETDQPAE